MKSSFVLFVLSVAAMFVAIEPRSNSLVAQDKKADAVATKKEDDAKSNWKKLFEPDSLKGWEITNFGGEGTVEVVEGVLKLGMGDPLTGVTFLGKEFPKENFELRWKATRIEGSDFLAGVTFPVGKEHCSFIAGGWGGGLVGLSSINGNDASENETASFHNFKNKQWYSFRVRVDKTHVSAWIDEKEVARVEREPGKFSLRAEVLKSRPLGYCVFQSNVEIKDWEFRTLE
jgi:hypothetical protein